MGWSLDTKPALGPTGQRLIGSGEEGKSSVDERSLSLGLYGEDGFSRTSPDREAGSVLVRALSPLEREEMWD